MWYGLRACGFADVMLIQPDLLLLDEAHAGLDKAAQALVKAAVQDVKERNADADPGELDGLIEEAVERARAHRS